ncbi:MAG TPA: glycosyltransferase family 4 protein [Bacteroidota bacterium]|nr:glycosyltransferase family 4 protein [Bacteroidota bacterium]
MNILVVNWQDITNPRAGGAEVHFQEIFSRVAARGHRVTLCCSSYPGAAAEETIGGVRIVRRGSRPLFNFRFPLTYLGAFRREAFDVVVEDLNKVPFFTPLYVRRPLAGIAHHLFGRSVFRETWLLSAAYVYVLERAALALYRTRVPFMVVSPSTEAEFSARGFPPGRLAVITNCVDHAHYTPGGKSPVPLLVWFGRLKKYKSADHFLRALPRVREAFPSVRAVVAGGGDDLARLRSIAKREGLERTVEFTGYVDEERKIRLLREAWCTVATSMKEGWGLTVVESNACGTPSVAADVPGLRDAVKDGETGLLYAHGDVEGLARCLIRVVGDDALRLRLSAAAIGWAGEFDWDRSAASTIEFLSRALSAASARG